MTAATLRHLQGMEMKGTILSVFVFASMLLLSAVANAQTTDRPACTSTILNGSYGVLHDGVVFGEAGHLAESRSRQV